MYKIVEIENIDLAKKNLIVFFGKSGCGKSSTINYLLESHPSFQDMSKIKIHGAPINWLNLEIQEDLVILDEAIRIIDVYHIFKLLRKSKRILVASHLPKFLHFPFYLFTSCSLVTLDKQSQRIEAYLEDQNITYSKQAINHYVKKYRANFTDLELILEQYPSKDFDLSLSQFEKFCHLQVSRVNV